MSYLTGVLVDVIHNLGKYVTGYVLEGDQGEVTLRQPALSKVVYQKGLKIVTSATEKHLQKDSTGKQNVYILVQQDNSFKAITW